MTDKLRLIETAFPLKQASLDSVHEKNVRQGHISTLHIWPARRPLAACRAALIATLLPDPGNTEERKQIVQQLGGSIVHAVKKKKLPSGKIEEKVYEETIGGILHWGRESGSDMEWFTKKIREVYGGRAPRVLDPFAGGGAIPLEAMRLGCEATAIDINPVAWFILKCTLEYPQHFTGRKRPLPAFALQDPEFMEDFLRAQGFKGALMRTQLEQLKLVDTIAPQFSGLEVNPAILEADLAWHVRAWGRWVLQCAREDLAKYYPVVDDKTTVAYLWARTVKCKNCRATLPLLKTRWLCKRDKKRVLLTMEPRPDGTGVTFGIREKVPVTGNNPAKRRENDKRTGAGTMTRAGATCPCCGSIMTMEDIRLEGQAGRLNSVMTAVVVEGDHGKEHRLPTEEELKVSLPSEEELSALSDAIPFGLPNESMPPKETLGFRVPLYGVDNWRKLFTPRQLLMLGTFVKHAREAREMMDSIGYSRDWREALTAYLACGIDRLVDFANMNTQWKVDADTINHALVRFAIQITWDFAEGNPIGDSAGSYLLCQNRIASALDVLSTLPVDGIMPKILRMSSTGKLPEADIILTDPPYYNAIPYSDLMDWFYIWLRRTVWGLSNEYDEAMKDPLGPKWDAEKNDGELIDDQSRFNGDAAKSKQAYEDGMAQVFTRCREALSSDGRLCVVFANKQPEAWETLVASIIKAGFVVVGSWPIQTEQPSRTRGQASAALSSSVWIVCKKRPESVRPGWDNRVLAEMQEKIATQLREFWDTGIRGPDFVWAATGPALEAYSKYPAVKKANEQSQLMTVSEFLGHVRRIVVDFVVGRVLSHNGDNESTLGLDQVTTYYLLHRHDFGMDEAPVGTCILYAVSCGLSDRALTDQLDVLARKDRESDDDEEETAEDAETEPNERSGSKVKLKAWNQRKRKNMGYEPAGSGAVPLIDQVHRLMHFWKAGNVVDVNEYLDERGLRRNVLFHQVLQALIELSASGSEERSMLESISNHLAVRGVTAQDRLPGA